MELISYGQFSREFHQALGSERIPLSGTIEVTRRCPLVCAHCYNNLPMNDAQARATELSLSEHRRILDQIADAGCLWLLYTGGEIFARADFPDIYIHAKKKGLIVSLFTNGTLITPRVADLLAEWRPFSVEITLYGSTPEIYERLTGVPGSYDRCLRGIRLLIERGVPLELKTVAVTLNYRDIPEMQRLARQLGLGLKFDAMMNPRIDCSQSPLAVRLAPEEVVRLDLQDAARLESWRQFCRQYNGPVHRLEVIDELHHCGGGVQSFAIDPQGLLSICVLSHSDVFDLRQGSFQEGWDRFLLQVRQKKITRMTRCVHCEIKAMCGMCAANGELEHGDAESPVDFLCHVAHLRSHLLDFPVPPHGDCPFCKSGERHPELLRSIAALKV